MSKNVNVQASSNQQIIFRSTGETDLRASEGKPVTVTGSPKDKNATVHGSTAQGVVIDNPA